MREHGNLNDASFESALGKCQWGLVVMDLDDQNPRYNRFSLPNKFGTYLGAGLPLLVVGHQNSSAIRMTRDYAVGFSLDSPDPAVLSQKMEEALQVPNPRERFRSTILKCAETEFNVAQMRRKLWNCFEDIGATN